MVKFQRWTIWPRDRHCAANSASLLPTMFLCVHKYTQIFRLTCRFVKRSEAQDFEFKLTRWNYGRINDWLCAGPIFHALQSVDFTIIASKDERKANNFSCQEGNVSGGADWDSLGVGASDGVCCAWRDCCVGDKVRQGCFALIHYVRRAKRMKQDEECILRMKPYRWSAKNRMEWYLINHHLIFTGFYNIIRPCFHLLYLNTKRG